MNKDYAIYFKEEYTRIQVYLVPHSVKIMSDSLFTINIGYIDLDENVHCFRCCDSKRMTIEVMESILSDWKQWELDRKKLPI